MYKEILKEINKLETATKRLRILASSHGISYEKGCEIRKQQDELWKKLQFYKGLVKEVK